MQTLFNQTSRSQVRWSKAPVRIRGAQVCIECPQVVRTAHPYMDGNGRMARFLMNAMLASGGYSWAAIRVEDRAAYLRALDSASIGMDISPFTKFIAACLKRPKLKVRDS